MPTEQYSAKQGGTSVKDGHMHSGCFGMWLVYVCFLSISVSKVSLMMSIKTLA